jgi:uncharacterized protein (TIGR02266 family)
MSDRPAKKDRKDLRAEAVLKVQYPDVEGFLHDYTVNISRGGTMIRVSRALAEGEQVKLMLSFPGLLAPISLMGVVRWVQQEGASDLTAGVEFEGQDPGAWEDLGNLVSRMMSGDRSIVSPLIRLLVVEDNLHLVRLISDGMAAYLKRNKEFLTFETRHASNGKQALEILEQQSFEVLLVDMYLPVMDGETFIRRVRQEPSLNAIPIIALSAGGNEAMERALRAGADFFLDKPVRLSDILDTLGRLSTTLKTKG